MRLQVTIVAWHKALNCCGIEDLRWHDLRHTLASWHVKNGTPLNVFQELGGWESAKWCEGMRIFQKITLQSLLIDYLVYLVIYGLDITFKLMPRCLKCYLFYSANKM